MQAVIWADDEKFNCLTGDCLAIVWQRVFDLPSFLQANADIYFNLNEDAFSIDFSGLSKPVIINSVVNTLAEINCSENVVRINGWNSFLKNNTWEIAGKTDRVMNDFFKLAGKKIIACNDEAGFISARIISMIINEAFFAKHDLVSHEQEIDTAMKLGTNYPYGPFEWVQIIGKENIFNLLIKLSATDKRYQPAPGLH